MEIQRRMLDRAAEYPSATDFDTKNDSKRASTSAATFDFWDEESPKIKRLGLAPKRKLEDSDDMSDDDTDLPEAMQSRRNFYEPNKIKLQAINVEDIARSKMA